MGALTTCLVPSQEHEHATDLQEAASTLTYNPGGSTLNGTAFSKYLVTAHGQSSVSGAPVWPERKAHRPWGHPKRSQAGYNQQQ